MSTFTIPGLRRTAREAATVARHAGQSPTQLKQRIAELTEETGVLAADCSTFNHDMVRSIVRGCQDAIALAIALEENEQLKVRVRRLGDKVVRAEADKQRLRQAVINARPRITQMDTQLVRPFAPEVVLPYVSPVPLVDLPQQREAS